MSESCQLVVFSNKAYNAIIRESFDKDPVETGGILLGHILDNGVWIVMEVLPPGINSIFQYAYFEYDEAFVNYLAHSVANQYKRPLDLLGLWHRHPGSMDVFSSTDDGTNTTFARQNPAGVISGLVNIDPNFRLTMYHLERSAYELARYTGRPHYDIIDIEVGDDIIPDEYFELRYYDGETSNLHPHIKEHRRERPTSYTVQQEREGLHNIDGESSRSRDNDLNIQTIINNQLPPQSDNNRATPKLVDDFFSFWRASKRKWKYILLAIIALLACVCTFKTCKKSLNEVSSWVSGLSDKDENKPSLSMDTIKLTEIGSSQTLTIANSKDSNANWTSSNPKVATVKKGKVTAVAEGEATIEAKIDRRSIGRCKVIVKVEEKENPTPKESEDAIDKELEENSEAANSSNGSINALIDTSHTYKNGKSVTFKVGESYKVPIKTIGQPKPEVSFTSTQSDIATVDVKGKITALKVGKTKIVILCNGENSDTLNVVITR